ncbi:hypothetical protein [Spirillospora sp. CA-128828]|uniref:hypothetical protein n=1 Tax=Spirillospora sp. CA-128828 TaxID=3240033 RepID=UPI003D91DB80
MREPLRANRYAETGGPTLAIRDSRRVFTPPIDGVQASDHDGLVADLGPEQSAALRR